MDIEAAVVAVLEAAGVPAAADELPETETRPVVLVSATGGPPASSQMPAHLRTQDVELACYADSKVEAADLAETARAALLAAPTSTVPVPIDGADPVVLTSITVNSPNWLPDEDWPVEGRPGPRYLVQTSITAHP